MLITKGNSHLSNLKSDKYQLTTPQLLRPMSQSNTIAVANNQSNQLEVQVDIHKIVEMKALELVELLETSTPKDMRVSAALLDLQEL